MATVYNRLNTNSAEFGIQDKEYLAKYVADRVRTTATVRFASHRDAPNIMTTNSIR